MPRQRQRKPINPNGVYTISTAEVAELKKVKRRTVVGWVERGLVSAKKITANAYLFDAEEINAFTPNPSGRPDLLALRQAKASRPAEPDQKTA